MLASDLVADVAVKLVLLTGLVLSDITGALEEVEMAVLATACPTLLCWSASVVCSRMPPRNTCTKAETLVILIKCLGIKPYLTEVRNPWDVCKVTDHFYQRLRVILISESEVAVDNLEAALDKLGTQQVRAGDRREALQLLGFQEDAFADTGLVVIKVNDKI